MKVIISNGSEYFRDVDSDLVKFLVEIGVLKNHLFYLPANMAGTHLTLAPDNGNVVIIRRDMSDCTEDDLIAAKRAWEGII